MIGQMLQACEWQAPYKGIYNLFFFFFFVYLRRTAVGKIVFSEFSICPDLAKEIDTVPAFSMHGRLGICPS